MEPINQWEKLAKYFSGELKREEYEKMKEWIKEDTEREKEIQKLYKIWKESGKLPDELKVDIYGAWKNLSENMDRVDQETRSFLFIHSQQESGFNHKTSRVSGSRIWRASVTVAAAAILLIAGFFSYQYQIVQEDPVEEEVGFRLLVAEDGERSTFVLNDGSRIILHAGSQLEVPILFNRNTREVYLEGEAYFDVSHDPSMPFIVNSEYGYTRVLGTKFLVQAWSGSEREVQVVVSEGRVALGENQSTSGTVNRGKEVTIVQNQRGLITGDSEPIVTQVTDLNWYMGWIEGRLEFNNRPLSEIITKLERWYNLDIKLSDESLAMKRLTAEIHIRQPMSEVLKGITLSLDLEFEKEGNTVTFRPIG